MNKEKILDKIKKCLALSKSANEHEAAQALKQAQALMEKYEVNAVDIALSEVSEQGADRRMAVKLAEWQWAVANMISEVFGCKCYQQGDAMVFYGLGNRAEIASYAFDVVYRQISAARREFLKTCRARKSSNRTYLADQFCNGWMMGAWGAVKEFEMSDDEKAVMADYKRKKHPYIAKAVVRDAKSSKLDGSAAMIKAIVKGHAAGKKVQLHHAMNGAEGVKQIGERK